MEKSVSRKRCGFTLIELLVVIAIIAVLGSLLLPALSSAKSTAHFVKCKSNLRQIGLGLRMYVDENGHYPMTGISGTPWKRWALAINSYLNQPLLHQDYDTTHDGNELKPYPGGVYLCPSDRRKIHGPGGSYGYNSFGMTRVSGPHTKHPNLGLAGSGLEVGNGGPYVTPVKDGSVIAPSEMIAIGEAFCGAYVQEKNVNRWDIHEAFGWIGREAWPAWPEFSTMPSNRRFRHRDKINVLFCDGHIEGPKLKKLFISTEDADLKLWNIDNEPHREFLPLLRR